MEGLVIHIVASAFHAPPAAIDLSLLFWEMLVNFAVGSNEPAVLNFPWLNHDRSLSTQGAQLPFQW